ncbi:MAG: anthranilate phosphoribosyltransferase [Candidatus Nanopelagicales bacterium]|jgi:anthranilate phosphoribosyltransferase|nr:anthranilate phosphoribosyltransferase [Actinomycetota bacterium]HNL51871.1 anthranilate phosphoribosyltransferase [Actinomycetota bacterium]HNO15374.1 anthranilate phosphoribosyltransferase [Actinomycetota bacterium]HUM86247.1 anthranilate phosphoribosyltransferase [Actinomycetota bacterium]
MTEWPQIFSALFARRQLQPEQTQWAMREILEDRATPAQIAAFAVLMRAKDETPEEIIDLLSVMLEHATSVAVPGPVLDVVGTGGDRAHTVNVSTMSAIVVAAAGARVVKHGNRAASSQSGSADVLEALGVVIDLPAQAVGPCLEQAGIAFCFAPVFHPALRFAGQARKDLAIPTFFNILGPLANPARPAAALVGCAFEPMAPVMADVLHKQGVRALVVRGLDGLDEISTEGPTTVWDATGPRVSLSQFTPETFGVARSPLSALRGGDATRNAELARDVFAGGGGPVRDVVIANAAAAWAAWASVSTAEIDTAARIREGVERVTHAIDSGAAATLLDRWIEVSRSLQG